MGGAVQVVTTLLEAVALAILLLAAVLAFVPSEYVVPAALAVEAAPMVLTSYGLSHRTRP